MRRIAIYVYLVIQFVIIFPVNAEDTVDKRLKQQPMVQPTRKNLAPKTMPTTPGQAIPANTTLSINQLSIPPAVCTSVPLAWNQILQKLAEANQAYHQTHSHQYHTDDDPIQIPAGYIGSYARTFVPKCCAASTSFSVAEQQAAGCTKNDQVGICIEKLVNKCLNNPGNEDIKRRMRESIAKHSELSRKILELTQQMQDMLNKMP